jgi:histidinol dehydrogenase
LRIIASKEFRGEILDRLVNRGKVDLSSISIEVRKIIADVRENGDAALLLYTEKFDNVHLIRSKLKVSKRKIKEAYKKLERSQINALKKAAMNIARFHKK